jgi:hypothetical protein
MTSKENQTPKDVLCANMSRLGERSGITDEQIRICAELLIERCLKEEKTESLSHIYTNICASLGAPSPSQRIQICRSICSLVDKSRLVLEQNVFGENESIDNVSRGKIAYIKNRRNDDAFLLFAKKLREVKAEYVSSFQEACEAVFEDKCEFCMLPIENDNDGKLYSFYQMLDRYDLKIRHTVRISTDDGAESITFALASRNAGTVLHTDSTVRFEFSVVRESADFVCDVLSALAAIGGRIYSVATFPVGYDSNSCRCYFAVDLKADAVVPMALYLSLEYHGYNALGWYTIKK